VQHQVSGLRNAAADGLSNCNKNDLDVVPALLVASLADKDENVRNVAKASLEKLHLTSTKAIQLCAKQLDSSVFAEAALRHSGEQAVPALVEALRAKELLSREKAARLLGRLGEQAAVAAPALTAALRDKNAEFRLAAAKGLWNITKQADVVVPVLVDLLKSKWAAEQAVQAAQASHPPQDGIEARRQFLQTVIEAMQRIGPPAEKAVSALKEKARDKNRLVAESARRALDVIAPALLLKA
jgi:HEAT repeat protein